MIYEVRVMRARDVALHLDDLDAILIDCVNLGASVGFWRPMQQATARAYWRAILADVTHGERIMLGAFIDGRLVGTAQLTPSNRENGRHRAEVQKVLVHSAQRGQGIGAALVNAVEAEALKIGRTLLVLDTRVGDDAARIYERAGFIRVGELPFFAMDETGKLEGTVFYYKLLEAE